MSTPRRIVVDDTDASINYGAGQWFPDDPNQLAIGNLGPIWNNTAHSTSRNATLSFAFNGTSITVSGSIQVTTNPDGSTDPTWTCLVDGSEIPFGDSPDFTFPENNWRLCDQPTLKSGSHNLTIEVRSKGTPFYLDRIIYTPTEDVSYDGAVLEYTAGDPAITYGSGWEFFAPEGPENITQTHGSQVSLAFHGTAVLLSAYVSHNLSHNATTASYAVDGGPATTFTLSGLAPTSTTTLFNIPLLSVDSLSPGAHNLVVTYEGDSTKTPLAVDTFYVTNSTTPSRIASAPTSSAPSAESPTTTHSASVDVVKHSNTGAIAGAIIASIVVLALVVGLLFWFRRRRRREFGESNEKFTIDAVEAGTAPTVAPFAGYAAAANRASPPVTQRPTATDLHSDPFQSEAHVEAAGAPSTIASYYPNPHSPAATGTSFPNPYSISAATDFEGASEPDHSVSPAEEAPPLPSKQTLANTPRRLVLVQRHQDSGVRLNTTPSMLKGRRAEGEPEIVELPPDYSQE